MKFILGMQFHKIDFTVVVIVYYSVCSLTVLLSLAMVKVWNMIAPSALPCQIYNIEALLSGSSTVVHEAYGLA